MNKPDPIRVSAEGIAPKPITMHEEPAQAAAEKRRSRNGAAGAAPAAAGCCKPCSAWFHSAVTLCM